MKRFCHFIFLTVVSFFTLFAYVNNVKADTFNFTIDETQFSLFNSNPYVIAKAYADNFIQQNSGFNSYYITQPNNDYIYVYLLNNNTSANVVNVFYSATKLIKVQFDSSGYTSVRFRTTTGSYTVSSSTASSSTVNLSLSSSTPPVINYQTLLIFYSSNIKIINQGTQTHTININSTNYSSTIEPGGVFPSLYDIKYQIDNPTPTPPTPTPSDYPLLSNFYSTFIDRLVFLSEYVSSNYIFLSLFVIMIIFSCLLLFRRLK